MKILFEFKQITHTQEHMYESSTLSSIFALHENMKYKKYIFSKFHKVK